LQTPSEVVTTSETPTVATDQTVTRTSDPYAGRRQNSTRLVQAVYLLFGVIVGLLLIRFLLRALAANSDAGFAQVIYTVTGVLVSPFTGLFGTPQVASGAALEVSTLVALIVYAGIGWVLVRLVQLLFGESRRERVARVSNTRTRVG